MDHYATPSHHIAILAHFSIKIGQNDNQMNMVAPHYFRDVSYSFPYPIERWKGPASTLRFLEGVDHHATLSHHIHILDHFSLKKRGQTDSRRNMLAPHCFRGVSYLSLYPIKRWQVPTQTLSELFRGVWTIMPPQVTSMVIGHFSSKWANMTAGGIWWHLNAAEVFHTSFHII